MKYFMFLVGVIGITLSSHAALVGKAGAILQKPCDGVSGDSEQVSCGMMMSLTSAPTLTLADSQAGFEEMKIYEAVAYEVNLHPSDAINSARLAEHFDVQTEDIQRAVNDLLYLGESVNSENIQSIVYY